MSAPVNPVIILSRGRYTIERDVRRSIRGLGPVVPSSCFRVYEEGRVDADGRRIPSTYHHIDDAIRHVDTAIRQDEEIARGRRWITEIEGERAARGGR